MATEQRFWVRFLLPDGEEDVHCLAVPRIGEHVELPGSTISYIVADVLHRMLTAADGATVQLIGVQLAIDTTPRAGASESDPE